MSLRLAGLGWVTPLGSGLDEVWQELCSGTEAKPTTLESSLGKKSCLVFNVPSAAVANAAQFSRLRRSSAISRFAVVAGLNALKDAGLTLDESSAARTALVFAISNGGVVYTKRFYHEIVQQGAAAASPLLFPETVFNAPASHLAAVLGITGSSYTLVGDSAVAILALQMAEDLMSNPELDRCLVVGAEEADWLLCDAYRKWRLVRPAPPIEPFAEPPRGTILSEGAGAVVLAREGAVLLEKVHPGANFAQQSKLGQALDPICEQLRGKGEVDLLLASANGTFVDAAEMAAAQKYFPDAAIYTPKPSLGEGVAAGSMWQLVCAALTLRKQELPPLLHAPESGLTMARAREKKSWRRAVVTTCGLNQQVAACALRVQGRVLMK
jgi:3-oxoacyl-(acyl-carrier-protein) synthase